MELILWRHAEAVDGFPDLERALTPNGHDQARRMAAWLAERLPGRTRLMSSPAVRARETAQALVKAAGLPMDVDDRLAPDQPPLDYLQAAGWPRDGRAESEADDDRVTVIVAHQPVLGYVASRLLTGQEQPMSVRKAAVWWIVRRIRDGEPQTVLKVSIGPEQLR